MAKFTRTAYAGGSLHDVVREVANQARLNTGFLGPWDLSEVYGEELSSRKAKGRKRVRITIIVTPEKAAPKRKPGPARKRPVQLTIDLPTEEQVVTTLKNKGAVLHHMLQQHAGGSTP